MLKGVRVVQVALAGALVVSLSLAHVDDPKGKVRRVTYTGPGWCAGSGCGNAEDGGLASGPAIAFPSSNIQLLAWLPVPQFNIGGAVNDTANVVESYVSPSGREYAIIGLSDGTGFVEVTDPGNPQIRSFIPSVESLWRDVRVHGQYCYTVSEGGGGIQVINLANLDTSGATLVGNVTADGPIPTQNTHTVFINNDSGYLYRAGGGQNGLRIYNLNTNPASPQYVAAWTARYVHEVTVVTYDSGPYAGKEIAFACGGLNGGHGSTGLYILDVTDKANIQQLSFYTYPNARYCHQGWLSPDKQYFYINDELDDTNFGFYSQTRIVDVSNLSAPTNAGTFTSGVNSIDHNLYTRDNLIFESNYRSGLRVFDATDPAAPVEIAFFDTWPEDDNASFNGLWDNDPFLPSGTILGSDIEKGLFIWRLGTGLLDFAYPDGLPTALSPVGQQVELSIIDAEGNADPATATLHMAIDGGAFNQSPLEHVGGATYRATFPAIDCGSIVRWYISVRTTSGVTVRHPATAPSAAHEGTGAIALTIGMDDDLETNTGWVVGLPTDDATAGIWVRADPVGTPAQPEDDHTPHPGVQCYITGNGTVGGAIGAADVDGGSTTLTSPIFDATLGPNPQIVYHRWYSNNMGAAPNADSMPILISNDAGANWTQLELVTENAGAWVRKSFRVADFVVPTSQMKIRFIARDLGQGSIVEAGVDDVRVEFLQCVRDGDINADGVVNVTDLLLVIAAWGPCPGGGEACDADTNGDGEVNVSDLLTVIANWG